MPVCFGAAALLLERPTKGVMRVVVGRRKVEHGPEFRLCLEPTVDAEVRDAERSPDGGLLGLEPLRLLGGDRRLSRLPLPESAAALLVEVVRVVQLVALSNRSASSRISAAMRCFA